MSPPPPIHVFRSHSHPLHTTAFSANNQLLYAGDEDGWITITDLKVKRVVAHWKAHESGVLGVGEWLGGLVR
jgi:WD40 repeat protein